ncbi:peptidoglycan recognition protein [Streptomyces sp. NPDC002574]|uniref:peptidoglycan recognition protein family protein n=1 Tax=Streptomyces sp. NPDC002574 TaxID=3364652 RepID=UPI0036A90E1F
MQSRHAATGSHHGTRGSRQGSDGPQRHIKGAHRSVRRSRRTATVLVVGTGAMGFVALTAWGVHHAVVHSPSPPVLYARPAPTPQVQPFPNLTDRVTMHRVPAYPAVEPRIVTRASWGADESLRHEAPHYGHAVEAVFLHHTDSGNGYACKDVPRIIRNIYTGHVRGKHWDDVAYNFFIDKCGTIYEGRAGGLAKPVTGAHAVGFNQDTIGVAAVGTFDAPGSVTHAMTEGIARLAAWKLGISGIDPRSKVTLVSSNDKSRFPKGKHAVFHVIAGHRDAFMTDCPGNALYAALPAIRAEAARLQGRPLARKG